MALDEALLDAAAAEGTTTLRFYRWSSPTLSLGYFQPYRERMTHPPSRWCALVRRPSGGGAILHDREWTYSFAAPAGSPLAVDALALFQSLHGALIDALRRQGVGARLHEAGPTVNHDKHDREPFLCFQRRAAGDVLLGEAKIAGSAQRRRRGAILQHGSLILGTSAAAPEIPGLHELTGRTIDADALRLDWQTGIAERLGLRLADGALTHSERTLAEQLLREKYSSPAWNEKR